MHIQDCFKISQCRLPDDLSDSQKNGADHLLSLVPGKWLAIDFVIDSIGNKRQLKMLTAIDPITNCQVRFNFSSFVRN